MNYIASKDGTQIAYQYNGVGPPLVMIHGTGTDHSYWEPILPRLERNFNVYTVDRRGRGQSGDTEPYAIQREYEDVAALVNSIPEKVFLLGHSYGALCSLETALLTTNISKLVLNEPPVYTTVEVSYPADSLDRFFAYLKAGEAEKALLMVFEIEGMPTTQLNLLKSLPSWQARILAVPTIPREVFSVRNYSFEPSRFKNLKTPILLLLGGESTLFYKAATETLHSALPHSRLVVLPGQQHDAVVTAPDIFLRKIISFFLGDC